MLITGANPIELNVRLPRIRYLKPVGIEINHH